MQEVQETSVEVQDLFAQAAEQVGGSVDLEDELEQLEAQMLEEELLKTQAPPTNTSTSTKIPTTANTTPATAASTPAAMAVPAGGSSGGGGSNALSADEEAQLAELQAQLNFA